MFRSLFRRKSVSSPAPKETQGPKLPSFELTPRIREQIAFTMDRYLPQETFSLHGRQIPIEVSELFWDDLYHILCAHSGRRPQRHISYREAVFDIIRTADLDTVIQCIRETISWLENSNPYQLKNKYAVNADPAGYIPSLNECLEFNGIEWRFTGPYLTPSSTTDAEEAIIEPAFTLLIAEGFEGAVEEFSQGMLDYRSGDYKSAVLHALKASESTMQTICDRLGWHTEGNPQASVLLKTVVANGLLPFGQELAYKTFFDTLKQGLPPLRNKTAGHGQGSEPVRIPDHVAQYAMNLAGTNITFLVRCYQARK